MQAGTPPARKLFARYSIDFQHPLFQKPLSSLKGIDHIGITVPDIEAATSFFQNVLGAEHLFYVGPFKAEDDWMAVNIGVNPRAVVNVLRLLRIANGPCLELFEYDAPDQDRSQAKNRDYSLNF